ncbi:MAG TPA: HAMP domain-containing sensor histidine kinase [Candidatus Didemnitutus sp.]|nr:HAMP domain-containing sensor histidine kinase [Candidatus Didemnitutus sp.]
MGSSRILLVHLPPACQPVARAAAQQAFPEAEIVECATLAEAFVTEPGRAPELLVLASPDETMATAAVQAIDAGGQLRWAVVILGGNLRDLAETVPPEEWTLPCLTRVFRSAFHQHELLRENLRLKGDLKTVARRVRHDLFTPIGCVATSAHVIEMLSPDDRETLGTMVDNIKVSSEEIGQLIERIAFVLRATADAPLPAPLDMGAVVAATLQQLDAEIKKAGASIALPDRWPEAKGVAPWLQVVWWNLIDNALKHSGRAPNVRLAWERVGDACRFSVIDRGDGIPVARRANLFRPFDRLHEQPAPGLGLSIVERLVALQGGICDYERQPDGASVFSFTLPAASTAT